MNKIISLLLLLNCFMLIGQKSESKLFTDNQTSQQDIDIAERHLKKSIDLINIDIDSAMFHIYEYEKIISKFPNAAKNYNYYKVLGSLQAAKGDMAESLEQYLKTKSKIESLLLKDPNNQQLKIDYIDSYILLGNAYLQQKDFNQALDYFNQSLLEIENQKIEDSVRELNLKIKVINNTAAIFIYKKEYDTALEFYSQALKLNDELNDKKTESSIKNNIGICYMEKGDYALSLNFFKQALEIRQEINDLRGVAQCYNNIGKNYALNNNFTTANYYFEEALKLGRQIGNSESIINSLQSLMVLYENTNDFKKAYYKQTELTHLRDSLFNAETVKRIAQIESNHKFEKQKELHSLELKRREAEKEKAELKYLLVGVGLFLLLAISILLIYLQKSKLKNLRLSREKLELKHKNTKLEKERLKEELDYKNRELTTKMMYLMKKNEVIESISHKLSELKKNAKFENQKAIRDMIVELNTKKDKDLWEEFETHFTAVHPDFYSRINEKFPNLTPNERKLCAFLRLNMNSKEISTITLQSVNSIVVSRTRLRKKLSIAGDDTNISSFLMNF